MRAGELRHRLTFQKKVRTRDSFKEMVETWEDFVTVWGSIKPLAGKRYFEASQLTAEVTGEVRIRYRSDILSTMRIIFEDKTLEIVSLVNIQERNRELLIYYKEALD